MKPASCRGCTLEHVNPAFGRPDGEEDAPLLIVGEAMGFEEARASSGPLPHFFVGPSGQFHWKQARRAGFKRAQTRVANTVFCRPVPQHVKEDQPPPFPAVQHCSPNLKRVLQEPHRAILTLGVPATREVCRHFGVAFKGSMDHWHGYVVGDGSHPWIIPTYHPSFISTHLRQLTGIYIHDLDKAWEVATQGFKRSKVDLVIDPPIEWFREWASQIRPGAWLSVDIETPRGAGSWRILRVNLACNGEQGVTVPFEGPYIAIIQDLLARADVQWYWNRHFDVPRLIKAGCPPRDAHDAKDAWHYLQSDMGGDEKDDRDTSSKATVEGNSLGFVAPIYSDQAPWKHLSEDEPEVYAAIDGVQTWRTAVGICLDLQQQGMWETYLTHSHKLHKEVLAPATRVGLPINVPALSAFGEVCRARAAEVETQVLRLVPDEILPLSKPYVKPPEGLEAPQRGSLPEDGSLIILRGSGGPGSLLARLEPTLVQVCEGCGAEQVPKTHKSCGKANVVMREIPVPRYYRREAFNADSPDHVRAYMGLKGLKTKPGKKAKTAKMGTGRVELDKLAKKDPFFKLIGDRRDVQKTINTYVEVVQEKLKETGDTRVHATFLDKPSTLRLSCVDPNLTNVIHGDDDEAAPPWDPKGFRRAIEASPGCELTELDYSGIEAVMTGWYCKDPGYIRLAGAGVHAYMVARTVDPSGTPSKDKLAAIPTPELKALLKPWRKHKLYLTKKVVVHGVSYGLSDHGLYTMHPEIFPTKKAAQAELDFFFSVCPEVKAWQTEVRLRATNMGYLGGTCPLGKGTKEGCRCGCHPFGYKHWFWDVWNWSKAAGKYVNGKDVNRVVAFYPQSTAAGIIKEAALRLVTPGPYYVGDLYHGDTPLRAIVHDSILSETPKEVTDLLIERASAGMQVPILSMPMPPEWGLGPHVTLDVGVKRGPNWQDMN